MIWMALAIELTQSCKRYQKYIFITTDTLFINNHIVIAIGFNFLRRVFLLLACSLCGDMET